MECRMFCFLNTSSKVDNQGCKNLSCICSDKSKHFFGLTDITAYQELHFQLLIGNPMQYQNEMSDIRYKLNCEDWELVPYPPMIL